MPDANGRRSISPELNPFDAFIGQDNDEDDLQSINSDNEKHDINGSLVPQQIPSIINESAIVRYYQDLKKVPIIISEGHQGTVKEFEETPAGDQEQFDVALALDVTTGCGGKIWPAAEVLGQYIASKRSNDEWKGKEVVELGAGTGLVGFLAAKATSLKKIWITDQIPMMKLMQKNLDLNSNIQDRCIIAELNWGESVPQEIPQYPDVLLLADCVYLEIAFQPLVDTMVEMSNKNTEILFCYQQRRKADKRFFKLLRKHFTFADISDDDPERAQQYNRQGTHLYRIYRK